MGELQVTLGTTAGSVTFYGSADSDTLIGSENDDTINGSAGSDYLYGRAGNDTLRADVTDAVVSGGSGRDTFGLFGTGLPETATRKRNPRPHVLTRRSS